VGASPQPSGKLRATESGRDLVLTRSFHSGIGEVWAELADPERTARWFGPWKGDARPGGRIACQMAFEEGEPEVEMSIDACDAPRHLALHSVDEHGSWLLDVNLREGAGETELELVHHLDANAQPGLVGPGWEYYLDMLVAAHDDLRLPSFDDYFPSQQAYYEGLVAGQE
jgi:uncharacterized protein YndB with AHSA1/START domain